MIGIVNYNMGNLRSVLNAFDALGEKVTVVATPQEMRAVDALIIPGVGAFRDGMNNLRTAGLIEPLNEMVIEQKKPFLGLCLGMQLIAQKSFEHGEYEGLGWTDFTVEKMEAIDPTLRIPHMGWNELQNIRHESPLFQGVEEPAVVYFVHSYYMKPLPGAESQVTSTCTHGQTIAATLEKGNIFGAQFHPEKSQHTGLKILQNFISIANASC